MLVVEGADCLGKTTLVAELREALGGAMCCSPAMLKLGKEHSTWRPVDYVAACKPWTLCDRFHLSEAVYGAVARGKSNLTPWAIGTIADAISGCGGMVVIVHASPSDYLRILDHAFDQGREAFGRHVCESANTAFCDLASRALRGNAETGTRVVRVTMNRTRHGPDWPSSRKAVVQGIVSEYLARQRQLHGGEVEAAPDSWARRLMASEARILDAAIKSVTACGQFALRREASATGMTVEVTTGQPGSELALHREAAAAAHRGDVQGVARLMDEAAAARKRLEE